MYARDLVEVDATTELPNEIEIDFPCGRSFVQTFEIETAPMFCQHCRMVGNATKNFKVTLESGQQPTPKPAFQPKSTPSDPPFSRTAVPSTIASYSAALLTHSLALEPLLTPSTPSIPPPNNQVEEPAAAPTTNNAPNSFLREMDRRRFGSSLKQLPLREGC